MDATTFSRHLRHEMTSAERRVWSIIRHGRLGPKFRRQVPRGPYFLDFACLDRRLVIEVDGTQHTEDGEVAADTKRDAWLTAHGFRVLRFWNREVLRNPEGVRLAILAALEEGNPEPPRDPPHPA